LPGVLRIRDLAADAPDALAERFGTRLIRSAAEAPIPASFWGGAEAGLTATGIYVRRDTPVHSLLHELGHYVCMTAERRARLWRDAGAADDEECAVCYLQVLLADALPGMGAGRCLDDMDTWGYSFREGKARAWFHGDGRDARRWLLTHGLIDAFPRPTWRLRL
jgi:hypothetical protein